MEPGGRGALRLHGRRGDGRKLEDLRRAGGRHAGGGRRILRRARAGTALPRGHLPDAEGRHAGRRGLFAVPVAVEDEQTGHVVIYYDISAQAGGAALRDLIEQLPLVTYIDEPPSPHRSISAHKSRAARLLRGRVARRSRALRQASPPRRSRAGPRRPRAGLRRRRLELVVRVPAGRSRRTDGLAAG